MIPTDSYALRALRILKNSNSALIGLHSHFFAGPKVIFFHTSMKNMTLGPWYHKENIKSARYIDFYL